jgi:hypothetical protein
VTAEGTATSSPTWPERLAELTDRITSAARGDQTKVAWPHLTFRLW